MRGIGQLRDDDGTRLGQETRKEAQDSSRRNKRLNVSGHALHDGKGNAGQGTNGNGEFSPETVRQPSDQEQSDDFASGIHRVHGTEEGTFRVAEVFPPLREGLQAVHHGAWDC